MCCLISRCFRKNVESTFVLQLHCLIFNFFKKKAICFFWCTRYTVISLYHRWPTLAHCVLRVMTFTLETRYVKSWPPLVYIVYQGFSNLFTHGTFWGSSRNTSVWNTVWETLYFTIIHKRLHVYMLQPVKYCSRYTCLCCLTWLKMCQRFWYLLNS